MRIKDLKIVGFLGRKDTVSLTFHEDLNIITGYNGAGKTNLLKLIWYTISGNFYALLDEVNFSSFSMTTDIYSVSVFKINKATCYGQFTDSAGTLFEFEDETYEDGDGDSHIINDARDLFDQKLRSLGGSIFFPTFRLNEGGYTISGESRSDNPILFNAGRPKGDLPDAVAAISRRLSNLGHTFVTSISTFDIAELLLRRFNEMSEEANGLQSKMSQDVISQIRAFRRRVELNTDDQEGGGAESVLENIKALIEHTDKDRERVMAPISAVQKLCSDIFHHKGIKINRRVSFGDTVNAINSDLLSAGEKQMLSFICYNAFTDQLPIFIDEPELSLHVDWQRMLFPTLISQKKNNQFIIATHSPFIYSKYPEKEIALVDDRGESIDQ